MDIAAEDLYAEAVETNQQMYLLDEKPPQYVRYFTDSISFETYFQFHRPAYVEIHTDIDSEQSIDAATSLFKEFNEKNVYHFEVAFPDKKSLTLSTQNMTKDSYIIAPRNTKGISDKIEHYLLNIYNNLNVPYTIGSDGVCVEPLAHIQRPNSVKIKNILYNLDKSNDPITFIVKSQDSSSSFFVGLKHVYDKTKQTYVRQLYGRVNVLGKEEECAQKDVNKMISAFKALDIELDSQDWLESDEISDKESHYIATRHTSKGITFYDDLLDAYEEICENTFKPPEIVHATNNKVSIDAYYDELSMVPHTYLIRCEDELILSPKDISALLENYGELNNFLLQLYAGKNVNNFIFKEKNNQLTVMSDLGFSDNLSIEKINFSSELLNKLDFEYNLIDNRFKGKNTHEISKKNQKEIFKLFPELLDNYSELSYALNSEKSDNSSEINVKGYKDVDRSSVMTSLNISLASSLNENNTRILLGELASDLNNAGFDMSGSWSFEEKK